jgi:N-acetylmuramoyl-L-alanine amidase
MYPLAPFRRRARALARALAVAAGLLVVAPLTPAAAPAAAAVRADAGDGLVAVLEGDRLFLESRPETSEGLLAFSRRLCGDPEAAAAVAAANDGAERLLAGVRYRVPFDLLRPELQRRTVEALFAADRAAADGWRHTAGAAGVARQESLWHLALWFTGRGENYRAIREYNRLGEEEVPPGSSVTIPAELLRPAFRGALPEASVLARREVGSPTAADFGLEYDRDAAGDYAAYRLRPGEALYSSVVVRFTGHLTAADVNALAADVAERSGIDDVTDIPVGYRVKVPFELLLPEFLPADHPRRREYEQSLQASARFTNQVQARGLEGITVILDPGHGGRDVGASLGGVWESAYVYDVALRVRRLLAEHTGARVVLTTRDGESFRIPDRDVLPFSRGHAVLTDPPYPIEDSRTGVHLRWYLANSVFRQAAKASGDPEKTVFVSLHADSLHPSVRGATVYVPGADMTGGTFGKSGAVYQARREYREAPRVQFAYRERVKSEGLSRQLAEDVVAEFRARGLALHPTKPIREKIIRQRSAWVPAVLRYNAVPAKVLLEIGNLANTEDRRLIQTRAFRQQVAEAVVQGILTYYGAEAGGVPLQVTAAR